MFGFTWFDGLLFLVMIGCFLGMRVCSKNQRTMKNAQLYALLLILLVFVAAGWFMWRNFLKEFFIDKAELSRARARTQWEAQGWGLGKYINGQMKTDNPKVEADRILVLYDDAEYVQPQVEAFKKGMVAAGVPESRMEFKVLEVSGQGAPVGMPMGMPGMSKEMLMTSADFKKAMPSSAPKVVISLLGLPRDAAQTGYRFASKDGKSAFLVGGNVYQNPTHIQLVQFGTVTGVLQLKDDAPTFEDSYSEEPAEAFEEFYELVTKNNASKFNSKVPGMGGMGGMGGAPTAPANNTKNSDLE